MNSFVKSMTVYIYDIDHPQAEGGTLAASLVADSEEAALEVLKRELFFYETEDPLLNGYLYEARLSMTATVPFDAELQRVIRLKTPEGATYSKKY